MIELINHSVQLLPDRPLLEEIEQAGRTCYKSEDKITEGSAERFVRTLVKNKHGAMTEFGTIYFDLEDLPLRKDWNPEEQKIVYNSHNTFKNNYYVTSNFRVILEAFDYDFDKAFAWIKEYNLPWDNRFERRIQFRIICDRGVTHELVRHRVFSFAQESTRYVRYSDKQPMRFICPAWWQYGPGEFCIVGDEMICQLKNMELSEVTTNGEAQGLIYTLQTTADAYAFLLDLGQTPQQARAVLPNALKTEIVMAGTLSQWKAFCILRDAPTAHPDMQPIGKFIAEAIKSYE